MRPKDRARSYLLESTLISFDENKRALPGIQHEDARLCFLEQIAESIHRVEYVGTVRKRNLSERRKDPNDDIFDPILAAILHQESGNTDEAFWLAFLFVHFGKHAKAGWRYLSEVYGRLGQGDIWTWNRMCNDTTGFRVWLDSHISVYQTIRRPRRIRKPPKIPKFRCIFTYRYRRSSPILCQLDSATENT